MLTCFTKMIISKQYQYTITTKKFLKVSIPYTCKKFLKKEFDIIIIISKMYSFFF
jgi:hypothetical protein